MGEDRRQGEKGTEDKGEVVNRALVIACVLAAACVTPNDDSKWVGITKDAETTCAWNKPYNGDKTGTCIARGQAFACIYNSGDDVVQCAPTARTHTPELGQ